MMCHDAQEEMDDMVSRLKVAKKAVDEDVSDLEALQDGVQQDKVATESMLAMGKAAQKVKAVNSELAR